MKAFITKGGKFYIQKWHTKRMLFKKYRITIKEAILCRRSKLEIVHNNVYCGRMWL